MFIDCGRSLRCVFWEWSSRWSRPGRMGSGASFGRRRFPKGLRGGRQSSTRESLCRVPAASLMEVGWPRARTKARSSLQIGVTPGEGVARGR